MGRGRVVCERGVEEGERGLGMVREGDGVRVGWFARGEGRVRGRGSRRERKSKENEGK